MRHDDDDGQIDGDAAAPFLSPGQPGSPFASSFGAQPWLRGNLPPWHMWGTIETVSTLSTVLALPATFTGTGQQLAKVNYKRPDTWQWLFYSRIVSAPDGGGGSNPAELAVDFDVTLGIGRASVTLPTFERFAWTWTGSPPLTDVRWSTAGRQPPRIAEPVDHSVVLLPAQDLNVNARYASAGPNPTVLTPFVLEIGAFFAPRTHMRPDWYLPPPQPLEAKFPGDEVGGR